jgi:hypothetical protein
MLARAVRGRSTLERAGLRERPLLHRQRRLQVDLRRLDRLVAEPQRNDRAVDARMEQVHRGGVPQAVYGHTLLRQRRARSGRRLAVLVQHVLHAVNGEAAAFGTGEEEVLRPYAARATTPGAPHGWIGLTGCSVPSVPSPGPARARQRRGPRRDR